MQMPNINLPSEMVNLTIATKAYKAKRLAEGKTDREISRCLQALRRRQIWQFLEHQSPVQLTLDKT